MELPVVAIKEPQLVDGRAEPAGTQKRRPKNNVQLEDGKISSIQSEHVASAAFIFGVLFCIIIIIAGKIHWGNDAPLCVVPIDVPFQDYTTTAVNYSNYPNPRCASLYKDGGRFPEDKGSTHYFWQLPPEKKNNVESQSFAWIFYSFHQIAIWVTIYVAQGKYGVSGVGKNNVESGQEDTKYVKGLRNINWVALAINFFCWLLHLLHTHVWYDALAVSVHEMSSQGSVILMLVFVLMIEAPRRGLFLGEKRTFVPNEEALLIVKKYHGYVFSWAVIYTFWYHPMEGYLGHLFGFFHVWIVMLQGSLMYTTVHLNRYWRLVCEAWVFIHGSVISMQTLPSNTW